MARWYCCCWWRTCRGLGKCWGTRRNVRQGQVALNLNEDGIVLSNYGLGVCHLLCQGRIASGERC